MSAFVAASHVDMALPPFDPASPDLPLPPPPPPPKFALPPDDASHSKRAPSLPPIDPSTSFDSLDPIREGSNPLAASPASATFPDGRAKKLNPLVDLIESEKVYVDQLSGIIRKVASAWSRSNLPPRDLDLMFRSLETVYKTNKQLLARLKEIGTNPSSPKALGDLLMKWIDDLEAPYATYCERYCTGFDDWEPVRNNERLPATLAAFSASNPPPLLAHADPHTSEPLLWTLDDLFVLPKGRLKYYKKLYGRLLKATQPGKSDYKLLLGASEKLDKLLTVIDARAKTTPSDLPRPPKVHMTTEDEVVVDFRTQRDSSKLQSSSTNEGATSSEASSARGSGLSSGARRSEETSATSVNGSTATWQIRITDLEHRLSIDRCLDIFTMNPKQVKLQMFPPNLPFVRELRLGVDVSMRLVPRSTGVEVHHQHGRIFILSDLFLACEAMTPQEKSEQPSDADMWLLYPPLAGKFLKVQAVEGSETILQITVMRKEKLMIEVDSPQARDKLLAEFQECIEFATAIHAASKHPVPPLPKAGLPSSQTAPDLQRSPSGPGQGSPSTNRSSSPGNTSTSGAFSPPRFASPGPQSGRGTPMSSQSLNEGMSRLVLSPEAQVHQGAQRVPSLHDHLPGPLQQRSSSQAQPFTGSRPLSPPQQPHPMAPQGARRFSPPTQGGIQPGQTFSPGQVISPGSFRPGQSILPGQTFGPGPSISQGQSFGPGQMLPPGPARPGQPMGSGPGLVFPPPRSTSVGLPPRPGPPPGSQAGGRPAPGGPPFMGPPPGQGGVHSLPPSPMENDFAPPNPPYGMNRTNRAPSDPSFQGGIRKSPSSHSLHSTYSGRPAFGYDQPPMPPNRPGGPYGPGMMPPRGNSMGNFEPTLPSARIGVSRTPSMSSGFAEPSPPGSPTSDAPPLPTGSITSTISASMKCKVFLKQQHAQWKSLGSAKLKLYRQNPTNVKQLVVEADDKQKSVLISTIVLTDGVERVGKTGVAVELSDQGARTGIIYMIQLRNEQSTVGLYESLLAGSDRSAK